jgi:outer membrane protein assembly factor BamB
MGLLQWASDEEHGQPVFPEITRANRYTRGVCTYMGTVYFTSGSCVYAFEPGESEMKTVYENGGAPLTALHVAGDSIFAGSQDGDVLHWALSYPQRPAKVLLRRQGTIYSVGKMLTGNGRFILVGARDYSVTAFNPMTGAVRQYMSPDLLRWVDGAGDFVFASSYSGHRVFAWDISRASRHIYSIPVDEMAQDIYVWEEDNQ